MMKPATRTQIKERFKVTLKTLIISELAATHHPKMEEFLEDFVNTFHERVPHVGLAMSIKISKEIRLAFTRYLAGTPLKSGEVSVRIALDSSGYPKKLGKIRSLVEDITPQQLRLILTILSYGRVYELQPEQKFPNSIADKASPTGSFPYDQFERFCSRRLRKFRFEGRGMTDTY
jgi:hypothetical protein